MVHRDMSHITRVKRYDLMLTPQFYIFKKESLPVSYQHQAVRLAPAILDELTGAGNYSYAAIKEDDDWVLIAYDMAKIESFLEEKGLPKNLINKLYFAQQAKEHFSHPVSVDERNALVTVDDTVVMLPKSIVGVEECGILTGAFRPEKGIAPSQSRRSWVNPKQAATISALLCTLAIGYTVEGVRHHNAIASVEQRIKNIKQRYPQLEGKSTMVLNSLYESNHKIDSLQRKIRDRLKEISGLTSKASKIDTLKIDINHYEASVTADKQHIAELKAYAKSQGLKAIDTNSSLKLQGVL